MKNNLVQTLKLRGGSSVGFEFCPLDTAGVDDTQVKIASVLSIQYVIFFFICSMALVLFLLHCFKLFMFGLGPLSVVFSFIMISRLGRWLFQHFPSPQQSWRRRHHHHKWVKLFQSFFVSILSTVLINDHDQQQIYSNAIYRKAQRDLRW